MDPVDPNPEHWFKGLFSIFRRRIWACTRVQRATWPAPSPPTSHSTSWRVRASSSPCKTVRSEQTRIIMVPGTGFFETGDCLYRIGRRWQGCLYLRFYGVGRFMLIHKTITWCTGTVYAHTSFSLERYQFPANEKVHKLYFFNENFNMLSKILKKLYRAYLVGTDEKDKTF